MMLPIERPAMLERIGWRLSKLIIMGCMDDAIRPESRREVK